MVANKYIFVAHTRTSNVDDFGFLGSETLVQSQLAATEHLKDMRTWTIWQKAKPAPHLSPLAIKLSCFSVRFGRCFAHSLLQESLLSVKTTPQHPMTKQDQIFIRGALGDMRAKGRTF